MIGVWYAAVGAVFVLGLLFIYVYARRAHQPQRGRHADADVGATPDAQPGLQAAQQDAADARRRAQADVAALRQAAEADAESTRRNARTDAHAATLHAEAVRSRAEREAAELVADARRTADADADQRAAELRRSEDDFAARARRAEAEQQWLEDERARITAAGAELDRSLALLANRQADLAANEEALARQAAELEQRGAELDERSAELIDRAYKLERELERVAGLSAPQARTEVLAAAEAAARRDAAVLVRSIENEARAEGAQRARAVVVEAVQRVASEQTAETVVSVLHLPNDEMKGRIIGREGRNIRAYESVTGVNLIIDDTPEAVLLSCFDPVRREIGRLTLDRLVLDGRIHPHRIEEAYEQSRAEVDELCLRAARDALADVGITDLDERLLPTLGRLKYRTSYGQNVLGHLLETAHIAGVMAAELGIEPTLVKRCAFLHDIGKALTHEVEGSHAIVGAELLRKYGEDEAVAHAVEAHHNEVQPRTIEAVLTQASDTCSAARPGARRESLEAYVKRLARIEEIAGAKDGVEKVFAMQSGREVRVMVQPSEVDDLAASVIAREIAKQIEDELTYPGQIRVTVVRESRATEIAH
jgi:ribonuclease Y